MIQTARRLATSRFATTSVWSALSVAVSAVTGILTARALGVENRGTLALILAIAGLSVLVAACGTNVSVRRLLPTGNASERGYLRTSAVLLVPLVMILATSIVVVGFFVDPEFHSVSVALSFLGYGAAYFLSNQTLDLLNAHGLITKSAMVNALGSIACMLLVIACVIFELGLVAVINSYSLSVLLQTLLGFALIRRGGTRQSANPHGGRSLLQQGARLLGLNLGQSLVYRSDVLLLGALSSQHNVGLYAVAITPAAVLRVPSSSLGQVSIHDLATGRISHRVLYKRLAMLMGAMVPLVIVGILLAPWIFPIVFGQEYRAAYRPFQILLVAEFFLVPFLVLSRGLVGAGSTWGASACGMLGVVVMIATGVFTIPQFGATGAAVASASAYFSMSMMSVVLFALQARASHRESQPQDVSRLD